MDILEGNNVITMSEYKNTIPLEDIEILILLRLDYFNAYVVGGAALSWYSGNPVNSRDIDICLEDNSKSEHIKNYYHEVFGSSVYESEHATTWRHIIGDKEYTIQILKNKNKSCIIDIINSFDITVCSIATNNKRWVLGENFAQDFKNKLLRFRHLHDGSAKRLIKYWSYGFIPTDDTINMVIHNKNTKWVFENSQEEDYTNAF